MLPNRYKKYRRNKKESPFQHSLMDFIVPYTFNLVLYTKQMTILQYIIGLIIILLSKIIIIIIIIIII
jgi:hypothetical protein